MLDTNLVAQLTAHFDKITRPIELVASLDDSPKSHELRDLLTQITGLSERISFNDAGDDSRRPSFVIRRSGTDVSLGFAGIPLGHEFTSLVLALLQVGGHPPTLDPEIIEQIQSLEGEYHFETFYSLTCQLCPDVVQALNLMSVLNPNISHVAIDGAIFRDEVERRKVMGVPSAFLDGELFESGHLTIAQILARLDSGTAERDAARMREMEPFEVLIVGGGPAGAAAAIYAARKGIRTGIVAERFGGQVLDTVAIENFISVPYTEGPKFVAALETHVKEYEVEILDRQKAVALHPAERAGDLIGVELENGATLRSRTVIISTGARWRAMNVPGEAEYRTKGVTTCPHCDGPLYKSKRVAVIGGGNSGVEAAIDLAGVVEHVTVLEFDPQLRADAVLQRKLESLPNTDVLVSALTTEVLGDGSSVTGLRYTDRTTDESHDLALEGVFVQIGLLPNTGWVKDTIELSDRGEVVIDAHGQTSVPGVFAAGDCTTVPYKQIVIALGAGSTASLSAFDYLIRNSVPSVAEAEAASVPTV